MPLTPSLSPIPRQARDEGEGVNLRFGAGRLAPREVAGEAGEVGEPAAMGGGG